MSQKFLIKLAQHMTFKLSVSVALQPGIGMYCSLQPYTRVYPTNTVPGNIANKCLMYPRETSSRPQNHIVTVLAAQENKNNIR